MVTTQGLARSARFHIRVFVESVLSTRVLLSPSTWDTSLPRRYRWMMSNFFHGFFPWIPSIGHRDPFNVLISSLMKNPTIFFHRAPLFCIAQHTTIPTCCIYRVNRCSKFYVQLRTPWLSALVVCTVLSIWECYYRRKFRGSLIPEIPFLEDDMVIR